MKTPAYIQHFLDNRSGTKSLNFINLSIVFRNRVLQQCHSYHSNNSLFHNSVQARRQIAQWSSPLDAPLPGGTFDVQVDHPNLNVKYTSAPATLQTVHIHSTAFFDCPVSFLLYSKFGLINPLNKQIWGSKLFCTSKFQA